MIVMIAMVVMVAMIAMVLLEHKIEPTVKKMMTKKKAKY